MKVFYLVIFLSLVRILSFSQLKQVGADSSDISVKGYANTYAIVIGISKYKEVPSLRFADKDALIFADYLRRSDGLALDSSNVKLFINEKATKDNIAYALTDIIQKQIKKGDRIILFFAGHGDYEGKTYKDQSLLLFYGAPKNNYFENIAGGDFLSTRDLNSRFIDPIVAKGAEVLLLIDACHAAGLNGKLIGGTEGSRITSMAIEKLASPIKFFSCKKTEESLESEQWGGGRGLFSYVLMEGLYGLADYNNDKQVTIEELKKYLEQNIPKLADPNKQHPVAVYETAQAVFAGVNQNLLATYKARKKRGLNFLFKTDTKGYIDLALLQASPSGKVQYVLCDSLINSMELEKAYSVFKQYSKSDSISYLYIELKRNLGTALQQFAREKIELANQNVDIVLSSPQTREFNIKAKEYLEMAASLLGEKHFLAPDIQARIWTLAAILLTKSGDSVNNVKAIEFAKKSIALEPDAAYSYFNLGLLFSLQLQPDSALLYINKYLDLVPNSALAHAMVGEVYYDRSDYKEAENYFLKAIAFKPDYVLAYSNLGRIEIQLKKYDAAIEMCKKAIQLDANYEYAYTNQSQAEYYLRNYDRAIELYQKAISINPSSFMSYRDLGNIYRAAKKYDSAIVCLNQGIKVKPDCAEFYGIIAQINYQNLKNNDTALINYQKCLSLDSSIIVCYLDISAIYSAKSDWENSIAYLQKWLESTKNMVNKGGVYNTRIQLIMMDKSFNYIRVQPAFKILMHRYFPVSELDKFPKLFLVQ